MSFINIEIGLSRVYRKYFIILFRENLPPTHREALTQCSETESR